MKTIAGNRIEVIDALRGFALMGILLVHFMEHFDAAGFKGESGDSMQWLSTTTADVIEFVFLGKAYAIFSLLFGLSFFIQMENNEKRGVDFRWRFIWRLVLLYFLGHINGLFYSGEILVVYALFGLVLIPFYKASVKWIWIFCIFFLFLVPNLIYMVYLGLNPDSTDITAVLSTGPRYVERIPILTEGTFLEVMSQNFWYGQITKWMYYLQPANAFRILGLFLSGLLIGRLGIHKDPILIVKYSKRGLLWGILLFIVFYSLHKLIPFFGIESADALNIARKVTQMYANLGLMFIIIGIFILSYFRLDAQTVLNKLAPVGRVSLTNYMMQSILGAFIFYGFGLGLAPYCNVFVSILLAFVFTAFQITFSHWWLKRYYYGPVEWLWRSLTWLSFTNVPFRRIY